MKKLIIILLVLVTLIVLVNRSLFEQVDKNVTKKIELLKTELEKSNYNPKWIVISGKRSKLYNSMLANSSKNSYHLQGKAIDLYVFDINDDGTFDKKDAEIMYKAILVVEKNHPELKGGFGTYFSKKISKRMIHIDIRGKHVRYDV